MRFSRVVEVIWREINAVRVKIGDRFFGRAKSVRTIARRAAAGFHWHKKTPRPSCGRAGNETSIRTAAETPRTGADALSPEQAKRSGRAGCVGAAL